MADDYIFLTTGNARETNPVIQVQNGKEMMEVKEFVDNTSGHSEHSKNVQMNENSPEEPEERKENRTTTGIHTIDNCIIQIELGNDDLQKQTWLTKNLN